MQNISRLEARSHVQGRSWTRPSGLARANGKLNLRQSCSRCELAHSRLRRRWFLTHSRFTLQLEDSGPLSFRWSMHAAWIKLISRPLSEPSSKHSTRSQNRVKFGVKVQESLWPITLIILTTRSQTLKSICNLQSSSLPNTETASSNYWDSTCSKRTQQSCRRSNSCASTWNPTTVCFGFSIGIQ